MRFFLERGADATLCNHSNQTALHVSQPALEGELLSALIRDLPHQMQLSDAAWRGDPCSLQDLMVSSSDFNFHLPFDCLICDTNTRFRQNRSDSIGSSLVDLYWPTVVREQDIFPCPSRKKLLSCSAFQQTMHGCVSQAQTDMLDFNKQNRDGLTPLMQAVRDVDLFEGLELPWKYQPVEVVKILMSLSV